jgi:3',5'-nucleoside bisphosphate phosphatase
MASARYDLHAHSTASDGTLSPRELMALAADRGLAGIALTDHDTVDGVAEAAAMALVLGVRCIPAVEISCSSEHAGLVHLLGYFVRPTAPELCTLLGEIQELRVRRAAAIVERVQALGAPLELAAVMEESGGRPPGRPHIARAMMKAGIVSEAVDAFSADWIAPGGRAWVHAPSVPVERAIDVVHRAGGAAVFAHPGSRAKGGVREAAVRHAASVGLDGIEVDHPDHTDDAVRRCVELARELDLVQTSGSDDHGAGVEGPRLGCRTVSERVVVNLELRARAHAQGLRA